jgi:ankyrin repeat protein
MSGQGILTAVLATFLFSLTPVSTQGIHEAIQAGDLARVSALAEADRSLVGTTDEDGRTPLALAILAGNSEMAELLLEMGADPAGPGARGLSAEDLAFYLDCQRGSGLTNVLLAHGGELVPDAPWAFPVSRLDLTATFGAAEMARLLVEEGADVNRPGRRNLTALALASLGGHLELVEVLLEAGADPELLDDTGHTPLSWALERGHSSVVRTLLAHGADALRVSDEGERTLLHTAALSGHLDAVGALIEHGVPVDARDGQGRTPLYYAGRYGHESIAQFLLARGADSSHLVKERFGPSPFVNRTPAEGEAFLWYLNHRGWAVKTSSRLLVFDQEEFGVTRPTDPSLANGFLTPREIRDQEVLALYTCYHGEIGEPAYIHEIEDSLRSVTYIQNAGDAWRGSDRSVYLSPRDSLVLEDARVTTIGTMTQMATLGLLVEVDGLVLYYQGFRPDDLDYYLSELDFLQTAVDHIDLAFLPIPEPGTDMDGSGFKAFMDRFHPPALALLDPSRREELYPGVADQVRSWGLGTVVLTAENPGDFFQLGG